MLKEVYSDNFPAMGTRFGMVLPGCAVRQGETVSQLIKDEIIRLENKISRFIPESSISILNRFAGKYPVTVDEELWNFLIECRDYNEITFGAFDLTLRAVGDYWNNRAFNTRGTGADEEAASLLDKTGFKNIEFNEEEHSVFFKSPEVEIDPGAVGKGMALRNIDLILNEKGIENAFISFGESSLLFRGSHPNGTEWKIGVPNNFNKNENCCTLQLTDCSVSTSGNTINNSIPGRVNIINPFTGLPVIERKSILAVDKDPVLAEVFSTAFMVLNDEQIITLLKKYTAVKAVKIEYNKENIPAVTEYTADILS
jgi:FAD:protein FMN transferase